MHKYNYWAKYKVVFATDDLPLICAASSIKGRICLIINEITIEKTVVAVEE